MSQKGIEISTWVVVQARKFASNLLKECEEYCFYSEKQNIPEKIKSPIIYVEADALRIKTCSQKEKRKIQIFCITLFIQERKREKLNLALDTMESNVILGTEEQQEDFRVFKKRLLYNYKCSATSGQRGLLYRDIPVIEASHKKITYRMKHSGMYLVAHRFTYNDSYYLNEGEKYPKGKGTF